VGGQTGQEYVEPLHLAAQFSSKGSGGVLLGLPTAMLTETDDGRTALDLVIRSYGYDHPIQVLYKEVS
jgi:hypothetical protein